jgi:hypothetical protein
LREIHHRKKKDPDDTLTFSSLDSSSSDVTGNTNELLEEFRKNKTTLTQKDTTPHTLFNNKSPPAKEDPSKTYLEGDQTTATTGKEPPLPIGEDTDTFMSNTSSPAKEDPMELYLRRRDPNSHTHHQQISTHQGSPHRSTPRRHRHDHYKRKNPPRIDSFNSDSRYSIDLLDHYYNLWTPNSAIDNERSELKPRGPKII